MPVDISTRHRVCQTSSRLEANALTASLYLSDREREWR